MAKTIWFFLLVAVVMLGCSKIHKVKDTTSLRLEIIEDEVTYRGGDTLLLNLKLTNTSARDAVIATDGRLFMLWSPTHTGDDFDDWIIERTYWFIGVDEGKRSDSLLQTLKAGDSRNFTVRFAPLESTAKFPELSLIACYHVTVEIDTTRVEYEVWSDDSVRIITEP